MLRILSLGAGVQSTTVALLAAEGAIAPLDAAIFADTGAEPQGVYAHLERLIPALPFPVHRITAGNLFIEIMKAATGVSQRGSHARPPFYVKSGGR